jgi:hypothetical protein
MKDQLAQLSQWFKEAQKPNYFGAVAVMSGRLRIDLPSRIMLLTQNLSLNFSQRMVKVFEIGSRAVYWQISQASGDGTVARAIGRQSSNSIVFERLTDRTRISHGVLIDEIIAPADSAAAKAPQVWQLSGCVVSSIAGSVQAADYTIIDQLKVVYRSFEVLPGVSERAAAAIR